MIDSPKEFEQLCARIKAAGRFGIDLEFVREKSYYPKICLIQISVDGTEALVDPMGRIDLAPLKALIGDPTVEKILHAGGQDLELMEQQPQGVFDTQIAASFLGMGDAIGYADLVRRVLGVTLRKHGQVDDWERRPLPDKLLKYAALDVKYLPELRERLSAELQKDGRLEWAREEFRVLEDKAIVVPQEAWMRVKGGGSLEERDLAVLASLAAWREREAARVNQPRQRIINDRTLLELARQAPKRREDVHVSRFFRVDQVRRYGEAILKAVHDGLSLSPDQWPRKDRSDHGPFIPQPTLDFLCAYVKHRSEEIGVGPARLATREDVTNLAVAVVRGQKDGCRLLSGWRWECVGRDLAALLSGDLSVRVRDRRLETFGGTAPRPGTSN